MLMTESWATELGHAHGHNVTVLQGNYVQSKHAYIMIELARHACMYMNLPMRVRCTVTFTVRIELVMIACMQ